MNKFTVKIATRKLILPSALFILAPSCTHQPVTLNDLSTVCFDTQVLPILQTSCGMSGCHGSGAEGFSPSDYASVMQLVVPGNAAKSKLYRVITGKGENMMPPNQPLSFEQRSIIEVWIDQGAMNTQCSTTSTNTGSSAVSTDTTTGTTVSSDSICFIQDVLPIFETSCATSGCHDVTTHKEGYTLTSYSNIMRGIVPYQPSQSKFYRVTGSGEDRMPPSPYDPLTTAQRDMIKKWIELGALNNSCSRSSSGSGCDTTGTISFSTQVWPTIHKYCVGCHSGAFLNGNISLDGYTNVKNTASIQRNTTSLLAGVIRGKSGFYKMPPFGPLDECTIRKIELWIDQGMQNN